MPPRKRAESAPQPEPEQADAPTETTSHAPQETKRGRRTAEAPCKICFPDGWPDSVTAVGCEHGSWTRD